MKSIDYRQLILSASYAVGEGLRAVPSDLINTLATMWANNERGLENVERNGTATTKGVPPL